MLRLSLLDDIYAIVQLNSQADVPRWALGSDGFLSITRTNDELSIVCKQAYVPSESHIEADWRCFKVMGPLDFSLTGILAKLANPLADAQVSIFAISTFDTDYLLVKKDKIDAAIQAWSEVAEISL